MRDHSYSSYLVIDNIPNLGNLHTGTRDYSPCRQIKADYPVEEVGETFYLVVINLFCIVSRRMSGLVWSMGLLAGRGANAVKKDWVRRPTAIQAACYFAGFAFGGGRKVHTMPMNEQGGLIDGAFGDGAIFEELQISPWRHNHAFLIR